MIVSIRKFTYDELVSKLKKDDKIVLFACGTCIKFCDIGGRERTSHLAEKLRADGYNVTREELVGAACLLDLIEKRKTDESTAKTFAEATVIIPLTCEDGYDNIAYAFPDAKVISVTKTVGLGVFSTDRGMTLTVPFENTGLKMNIEGHSLADVAKKLGCHAGPYYDGNEKA
ncbi:MAG TPA: hypothetical protein VJY42_01240 [Candidatus Methanomethylophilaceae archaeon]|nr:hypothetical protein [Candidatus Methanomethylophilaceae archaeon]